MSHIRVTITYAGIEIPVVKDALGRDATPLKPIVDLFGLQWRDQRKRVVENEYYLNRLGITEVEPGGDIPPCEAHPGGDIPTSCASKNSTYLPTVLIRVDRVATYLSSINPARVRAAGNEDGARFLMEKQSEWDDALHDYEELGVAVNLRHERTQAALVKHSLAFARIVATRSKTSDATDRAALGQLLARLARDMDVTYQLELPE